MRRNVLQARSLATDLDYIPHDILRDAFPPYLSRPGDGSKDSSACDPGCSYPLIERCLDPFWNRHRTDAAALSDKIYHCPVPLAHLDFIQLQADQLRSAEATTEQHGQHGVVALCSHTVTTSMLEYLRTLLRAQPITGTEPELLDSFDPADASRQLGTQQARVCGFMSEAAH